MKASELKVGDRIRITGLPEAGVPGYRILPETVRVYRKVINRKRAVRIYTVDEFGSPWFACRFLKAGRWEHHRIAVNDSDNNWVPVKIREFK